MSRPRDTKVVQAEPVGLDLPVFDHEEPPRVSLGVSVRKNRPKVKKSVRRRVLKRCGGKCKHCGSTGSRDNPLTVDHIIPLAKGGPNVEANMQILCRNCNMVKGDTLPWKR